MHQLEAGQREQALFTLLGLDDARARMRFESLLAARPRRDLPRRARHPEPRRRGGLLPLPLLGSDVS